MIFTIDPSQLESKFAASGHCFQESEVAGSSASTLLRPLKLLRAVEEASIKSRTAAIVGSLRRLQQGIVSGEGEASAVIPGIGKLTIDS